jgi:cytochrome P450
MALVPYGTWWRRHRRAFHDFFHPNIVDIYRPIQLNTARKFIQNLLKSPKGFDQWIAQSVAPIEHDITD